MIQVLKVIDIIIMDIDDELKKYNLSDPKIEQK
jgi:hypothetical protein